MIKDVFVLKKKSWHTWLMKWVWGWTPDDFRNMCPYFWLTNLNLLIFIPFSVIKLVILGMVAISIGMGFIINKVSNANKTRKAAREEAYQAELCKLAISGDMNAFNKVYSKLSYESLRLTESWITGYMIDTEDNKLKRFEELKAKYLNWREERYKELEAKRELAYKKEEEAYEARKNRQILIGKIVSKLKIGAYLIGIAFAAFIYYWLILAIDSVVTFFERHTIHWANLGWEITIVLGWITLTLLAVLNFYLILLLFQDPIEKVIETLQQNEVGNKLGRFLLKCCYPFIKIWNFLCWIGRGIRTIWDIVMAIKSNNCPGINWK